MKRRSIPGYEGLYEITEDGRVFSISKNIEMKLQENYGYMSVTLYKNGKKYYNKVHRLVLLTFIGPSKLEVNHLDGNKKNNNISNLEYSTRSQNMIHAFKNGLKKKEFGEANNFNKLSSLEVKSIRLLLKTNITQREIAEKFKVHQSLISYIKTGKIWNEKI